MKIGLFVIMAMLAISIAACATQEVKTVQQKPAEVTIAGDASATQIEQTFDEGFPLESETESDDIDPADFEY